MKLSCSDPPVILITEEAKAKLDGYIELCPEEISGLGRVVMPKASTFLITDILLFSQEVSAGSTDLDQATVAQFVVEALQGDHKPEELKVWWHSHVNGSCFWSGTDNTTIEGFINGWMISVVGNKKGEYMARLDIYDPLRLLLDDIALSVQATKNKGLLEKLKLEMDQKVRQKSYGYAGWVNQERTPNRGSWSQGKVYDYQTASWVWPKDLEDRKKTEEVDEEGLTPGQLRHGLY
jgi:hypothetical protein